MDASATINLKWEHAVQASVQVADFIKQHTENGTQEWSKERNTNNHTTLVIIQVIYSW